MKKSMIVVAAIMMAVFVAMPAYAGCNKNVVDIPTAVVPVEETTAKETEAPTKAPETSAPETKAPETTAPETKAPESTTAPTTAAETTAAETSAVETSAVETTAVITTAETTTAAELTTAATSSHTPSDDDDDDGALPDGPVKVRKNKLASTETKAVIEATYVEPGAAVTEEKVDETEVVTKAVSMPKTGDSSAFSVSVVKVIAGVLLSLAVAFFAVTIYRRRKI